MKALELVANLINAASIVLAGRNSVQTWWTGIVGAVLFGWLFFDAKLYADVTLQIFFIGTSLWGWYVWRAGESGGESPVRRTRGSVLMAFLAVALVVALAYGWLLQRFTDAWSPFWDSVVLSASVLAQLLLMQRRVETWPVWLLVNTLAVPLFWRRGLYLTSVLYAGFWLNALVSIAHWRRLLERGEPAP
ncbi:MAG: nicotinamide riboside transporter PnuC [Polyangiaceae bacterium]